MGQNMNFMKLIGTKQLHYFLNYTVDSCSFEILVCSHAMIDYSQEIRDC